MTIIEEDWEKPGHWFDYYNFLGIKFTATDEEIKKAYRNLAKKYHPDNHIGEDETSQKKAEDNFKKLNMVNEILSKEDKRKAYDRDYINRTSKTYNNSTSYTHTQNQSRTNTQNQNKTNNQNRTNNNHNTQNNSSQTSANSNDNKTKTLEDIINDYIQNPNDIQKQFDLKQAFKIILTSFTDFSKLTDEAFKEFYDNIYKSIVDEPTFMNTKNDLISIINEELNKINEFEKEFATFYIDLNMFNEKDTLKGIKEEYKRKITTLSLNYKQTLSNEKKYRKSETKKYYYNSSLLIAEFNKKIEDTDKKLSEIKKKFQDEDKLLEAKNELLSLINEYNDILDWILNIKKTKFILFEENTAKTRALLIQYENIIDNKIIEANNELYMQGDIDERIKNNTFVDNLIVSLNDAIKEIKEYNSYELLNEKINDGSLNEQNYCIIKSHLNDTIKDINKRLNELSYKQIRERKQSVLYNLKNEYMKVCNYIIILNISYEELLSQTKRKAYYEKRDKERLEAETKAQDLKKRLNQIVNYIFYIRERTIPYKKILNSQEFKDVDSYILLCKKIIDEMKALPGYEERKEDLSSWIFGLNIDCERVLKILENYKKVINIMASFEIWLDYCKNNIDRLQKEYDSLCKEIESLIQNENQSDKTYKDIISKINIIFEDGRKIRWDTGISLIDNVNRTTSLLTLENELDTLYITRRQYNKKKPNFRVDTKLHERYKKLEQDIKNHIKLYTLDYIKELRIANEYNSLKSKSKNLMDKIEFLIKQQIYSVDWKQIILLKNELTNFLKELNQIINKQPDKNKNEEMWKHYQEIKTFIEKTPISDKELIDMLKLETLDLFKEYNENKKKIYSSERVSTEELNEYITNLYNYHTKINYIKYLNTEDNKSLNMIYEFEIELYNAIIGELNNLHIHKNADIELLLEQYSKKLHDTQKCLFYYKNENSSNKDLLWDLDELKRKLESSPLNEKIFIEYLSALGKLTLEEYLSNNIQEGLSPLDKKVIELEAKRAALLTEKQALLEYIYSNGLDETFANNQSILIENDLDCCEEEINILKL